jgi:hypothetical protein
MDEYLRRAAASLASFETTLESLAAAAAAAVGTLPPKSGEKLLERLSRIREAMGRLRHSLNQMATTGLDIVDLQVRIEGEGAALASSLKALGELIEKTPAISSTLAPQLLQLEEGAERVASALFPNAIEGAREINRTLWNFRPLKLEYGRILAREVARTGDNRMTAEDIARVQEAANAINDGFERVNELLNTLVVMGTADGPSVRTLIREARTTLGSVVANARKRAADRYKPFHGVLKRAESLARDIDAKFAGLKVPVFPPTDRLAALAPAIAPALYAELAGVERFALLNIGARLCSIACHSNGSEHLLSPRFEVRIFEVFPDRVYFTATREFIDEVQALADAGSFEPAPASLHRYNEGSFKQTTFRKGNLQVSFAHGTADRPGDRSLVSVDADIDLYRSTVGHLFGEVLVNHLTGSKTDQFKVWNILATTTTSPLGGFEVVTV